MWLHRKQAPPRLPPRRLLRFDLLHVQNAVVTQCDNAAKIQVMGENHPAFRNRLLHNAMIRQALQPPIAKMHSIVSVGTEIVRRTLRQSHVQKEFHAAAASGV